MEPGQQPTAVYPHSTDGAKWASGLVLRGDDFAQLNALSKARARKPDVVLVEVPAKSWDQITRRSRLQDMLGGSSVRNVWWVPIVPEGGSAQGAVAGSDSAKWSSFGKALQDTRNGSSVVRLNMDSLAGVDAASRSKAWQSAAAAIKSSAPGALVEWVVPAGVTLADVKAEYPGDDVVDMISVDLVRSANATWVDQVNRDGGLNDLSGWAASRSKTLSLHWSLGDQGNASSADAWVQNVHDWIARQRSAGVLAYEAYGELRKMADSSGAATYRRLF